jgi:hypothetical protein
MNPDEKETGLRRKRKKRNKTKQKCGVGARRRVGGKMTSRADDRGVGGEGQSQLSSWLC